MTKNELIDKIKSAIDDFGATQQSIADACNVEQSTVSDWLNGSNIRSANRRKLLRHLASVGIPATEKRTRKDVLKYLIREHEAVLALRDERIKCLEVEVARLHETLRAFGLARPAATRGVSHSSRWHGRI